LAIVAVRGQDQTAIQDSVHLMRSVLASIDRRPSDQLLDYSYWDEAVLNLVTKPDPVWADKNVGNYMYENFKITSSFVLDGRNRATFGMIGGKRSDKNPLALYSGGLEKLLSRTRSWPNTAPPISASGMISDGKTIHIASASVLTRFRPEKQKTKTVIGTNSVLIFTRKLDRVMLDELSENYLLNDLKFVPKDTSHLAAAIPLTGVGGETLGYLTWNVKSPAGEMMRWLLPLIGGVLMVFAGTAHLFFKKTQTVVETLEDNITEIEAGQQALRASENKFKDFAEVASDWFWESDAAHRFTYFSGRNFKVTGSDPEKIIGRTRFENAGEDINTEKWRDHIATLNAHRPFYDFQYNLKTTYGETITISINGNPVFDDNGVFTGYRGTGSDITKRKRAEIALMESEKRFRDIAESSSDWFWETDEKFRFRYISDRGFKTLKLRPEDILGLSRKELAGVKQTEGDQEKWREHFDDLDAHRPFRDFAYILTGNDGKERYVQISGVPIFDESGAFTGYRGTGTDVTDLKHAEQALQESEERHRYFAADAAHELRTPLAVLRSNLDQLEDTNAVNSLREDVDSMTRMVEQLLTFSRLDTLASSSFQEADIKDACTSVAAHLGPVAVMEQRSIEVLATEDPVFILGDADAIKHAVRNLIENAIKYSARGTTITIEVNDEPSIRVIDHGCGIKPENKMDIFKRFLRSDRRSAGAGLGLSIVQRVVEAHHGAIEVEDTPGGGATLIIRFPKIMKLMQEDFSNRRGITASNDG